MRGMVVNNIEMMPVLSPDPSGACSDLTMVAIKARNKITALIASVSPCVWFWPFTFCGAAIVASVIKARIALSSTSEAVVVNHTRAAPSAAPFLASKMASKAAVNYPKVRAAFRLVTFAAAANAVPLLSLPIVFMNASVVALPAVRPAV